MPESEDAEVKFFSCPAHDPGGAEYSVDVVPMHGSVSRFHLGTMKGGPAGPLLRTINRLLARVQPDPETYVEAMVSVYRVTDGEYEDIHNVPVTDFEQGRSTALAIAAQIESGTFEAEG